MKRGSVRKAALMESKKTAKAFTAIVLYFLALSRVEEIKIWGPGNTNYFIIMKA